MGDDPHRTRAHILVVHGALGSAQQMKPVVDALRALADVTPVELPGHGATPLGHVRFTIGGYVSWLRGAVGSARAGAGSLYAFGYSMGGYITLAHELAHPGTFAGIATLGTKFAWTADLAAAGARRLDAEAMSTKVPAFAAALEARHAQGDGWRDMLAGTRALLTDLGGAPLLTADTVSQIGARVRLGVGSDDDTVDADETCAMARAIPRGECRVLAGAPHPIERVPAQHIVELMRDVMRG